MAISMYLVSAPRFANTLKNLSAILDKAQAHYEAKKYDAPAIMSYRLFPDMFPFARQGTQGRTHEKKQVAESPCTLQRLVGRGRGI